MALSTHQIVKILKLEKVGRKTAFKICQSALSVTLSNDDDLVQFIMDGIDSKSFQRLPHYSKSDFRYAFDKGEEIIKNSEENDVRLISYFDDQFPTSLKNISDPPIILNIKGDIEKLNKMPGIAIIGTREPTQEGIQSGEYFGEQFANAGFNVVSGLAKGCDSAGHWGCLKAKGTTTAIVAHGLHMIYPAENTQLADDILSGGGIILSEYMYGTNALANYFVERDRLQSGLSIGTIVIQTGIKGGTMHAVNATKESGKVLAAVQYKNSIKSDKIDGNIMLISQGAFGLTAKNFDQLITLLSPKNQSKPQQNGASNSNHTSKSGQIDMSFE